LILTALTVGAVTFGVFQQLRGAPASIGQCNRRRAGADAVGDRRLHLIGLVVFGVILVPSCRRRLLQSSPIIALVIVAIPTLLVVSVLWVAVPATVDGADLGVRRAGPQRST